MLLHTSQRTHFEGASVRKGDEEKKVLWRRQGRWLSGVGGAFLCSKAFSLPDAVKCKGGPRVSPPCLLYPHQPSKQFWNGTESWEGERERVRAIHSQLRNGLHEILWMFLLVVISCTYTFIRRHKIYTNIFAFWAVRATLNDISSILAHFHWMKRSRPGEGGGKTPPSTPLSFKKYREAEGCFWLSAVNMFLPVRKWGCRIKGWVTMGRIILSSAHSLSLP